MAGCLLANLLFYAWGEPAFIFLLLVSTFVEFLVSVIGKRPRINLQAKRRPWPFAVTVNVGCLRALQICRAGRGFAQRAAEICRPRQLACAAHRAAHRHLVFHVPRAVLHHRHLPPQMAGGPRSARCGALHIFFPATHCRSNFCTGLPSPRSWSARQFRSGRFLRRSAVCRRPGISTCILTFRIGF